MVMWRRHPNPMTDEERQREIRRLEAVRDQLLHVAPMHFYLRRLLLPIMLAMTLFVLWHTASTRSLDLTIGPTLLLTGFLVVVCYAAWKFWKSPPIPADKWEFSDRLEHEGNSVRDVQQKIDELRSASGDDINPS